VIEYVLLQDKQIKEDYLPKILYLVALHVDLDVVVVMLLLLGNIGKKLVLLQVDYMEI